MSLLKEAQSIRSDLPSTFDSARAILWIRSAEQAISDQRYDNAAMRLISAALWVAESPTDSALKNRLANLLLHVSIRSENVKTITQSATVARRLAEKVNLHPLSDLSRVASERFLINQICVAAFPGNIEARIELADSAERAGHPLANVAQYFRQARELAGESKALDLRAGVALIRGGEIKEGRKILRALDKTQLSPKEKLWTIVGYARTGKWLDRLRAFDILLDLYRELINEKYALHELNTQDWEAAFFDFLNLLPVDLNPQEMERLEEEAEFFKDIYKDAINESVRFRESLENENEELASLQDLVFPKPVSEIVLALRFDDKEMLFEALHELAQTSKNEEDAIPSMAAIWPFLLEQEFDFEAADLASIAEVFAKKARCPSYGWTLLALKFFSAKLPQAGASIAKRMVLDGEEHEQSAKVIAAALKWSLEHGKDKALLFWLDQYEELNSVEK